MPEKILATTTRAQHNSPFAASRTLDDVNARTGPDRTPHGSPPTLNVQSISAEGRSVRKCAKTKQQRDALRAMCVRTATRGGRFGCRATTLQALQTFPPGEKLPFSYGERTKTTNTHTHPNTNTHTDTNASKSHCPPLPRPRRCHRLRRPFSRRPETRGDSCPRSERGPSRRRG